MLQRFQIHRLMLLGAVALIFASCRTNRILEVDKADDVLRVEAYEKKVHVKELSPPAPEATPDPKAEAAATDATMKKSAKKKTKKEKPPGPPPKHEPAIEDPEGFIGRRPIVDPFRVGENVTLNITWANIVAGTMELQVLPFVEVNGKKAYQFQVLAKSNSFFEKIYSVDDKAVTYVDYEKLMPHNLSITVKESKQLAETRTFVDWTKNKANYWQKKVTKDKGERSKELSWDVLPYSQNVISAAYYIRMFNWRENTEYALRVADEGKNIVFRAKVLRREKLRTDIGTLDTIVIQPKIEVDGAFKPVGDLLVWLTDDDRKFIVRVESKIKIGSIVAKLKSIDKGLGQ
jgi:hypothetical protein